MQDTKFSFNSELDDYFHFELNKIIFKMKYPTTEEIEEVDKLQAKINKLGKKKTITEADKAEAKKLNDKIEAQVYGGVETVNGEDVDIKEEVKKLAFRTQNAFYNALYTEYYSLIDTPKDTPVEQPQEG